MKLDQEILDYVNALRKQDRKRIELQKELRHVFKLDWQHPFNGKDDWVIPVRSPQPYNATMWLAEALCVNPVSIEIVVPADALRKEDVADKGDAAWATAAKVYLRKMSHWFANLMKERVEPQEMSKFLRDVVGCILKENDDRNSRSLQFLMTLHALIDGQIAVVVNDLRAREDWDEPINKGRSPFVIKAIDPTSISVERDDLGIHCAIRSYLRTLGDVKAIYPKAKMEDYEDYDNVTYREYWTRKRKVIWIEPVGGMTKEKLEGTEAAVVLEDAENTIGLIPFLVKEVEGTETLGEDATIMPFLYPAYKSGSLKMSDIMLSAMSSRDFRENANPQYKNTGLMDVQETQDLHLEKPYVYGLRQGEDLVPMPTGTGDKLVHGYETVSALVNESTVPMIVGGFFGGTRMAGAAISLLQHGGMLKSTLPEKAMGAVYRDIVQYILYLIRNTNKLYGKDAGLELYSEYGTLEVEADELPTYVYVDVTSKPELPQEKIAMIQAGDLAHREGAISMNTWRDWIGVRDKEKEQREIDDERKHAQSAQPSGSGQPPNSQMPSAQPDIQNMPSQVLSPAMQRGMPPGQNPLGEANQNSLNSYNKSKVKLG